MKHLRHLAVAFAVYLALLGLPHPCEAGYLVAGSEEGILYDIDPVTGLASNPRDTGLDALAGLGYSSDGILYGADHDSLYQIDLDSGTTELVGTQGPFVVVYDFDIDPIADLLYVVGLRLEGGGGVSILYTIDLQTAAPTLVAEHVPGGPVVFDSSGQLWALGGAWDMLHVLDKQSGVPVSSIPLSTDLHPSGALALDENNTLFALSYDLDRVDRLYAIDVSTGTVSPIGETGLAARLYSLAYIPEPGTLLVLAVGAVACIRRRKSAR